MRKGYRGTEYVVCTNGMGAFCGYIKIPDGHPWNRLVDKTSKYTFPKKYGGRTHTCYDGYDDIPLDVHGGPTFSRRISKKNEEEWPWVQGFSEGAWVGWDYSHYDDFVPGLSGFRRGKKWTRGEVEKECKRAIDQMLEFAKKK